jgi:DMSO/TMAO reductase YedYZ molybdopterin-dependent catalytic subunit
MTAKKVSRRRFLMLGAIGTASLLIPDLSACSPTQAGTFNLVTPTLTPPAPPTPTLPASASPTPNPPVSITPAACRPSAVAVPTRPAELPGHNELDPATKLHMTGKPVDIDLNNFRLKVSGKINHPLSLSLDELRCMPKMTTKSTSICPGFFEDHATWAGVPFPYILDMADIQPEATYVTLKGADGYSAITFLTNARATGAYLAYEWEGQPIPILHGFPLRAIYAIETGAYRVKWLLEIEIS